MSEDDNSANLEEWIEPELEARVVAWVLGEASAFEAAELERLVQEKPELAIFKRRIEAVNGLVRDGFKKDRQLRLAPEKRAKLLAALGAVPIAKPRVVSISQRPSAKLKIWNSELLLPAVAACVIIGTFWLLANTMVLFRSGGTLGISDSGTSYTISSEARFAAPMDGAELADAEESLATTLGDEAEEDQNNPQDRRQLLGRLQEPKQEEELSKVPQSFASSSSSYYESSVLSAGQREMKRRELGTLAKNESYLKSAEGIAAQAEAQVEQDHKPSGDTTLEARTGGKVIVDKNPPPVAPEKWWSSDLSFDYDKLYIFRGVSVLGNSADDGLLSQTTPKKEASSGSEDFDITIDYGGTSKQYSLANNNLPIGGPYNELDVLPSAVAAKERSELTPAFPITPDTPTEWEENRTVETFEGFINYGSPIQTFSIDGLQPQIATESVINQPIFSTQDGAEREIARRNTDVIHAGVAIQNAEEALKSKDVEVAAKEYQKAFELVPHAMKSDSTYRTALEGFGESTVLLAQQRIAEGRPEDAKVALEYYLEANPDYRPALEIRKHLEDPSYYDPTVTPGLVDNVEKVKKLQREAKGFKDTGRYDLAHKRYEQVLAIDKNNVAARRGMEEVTYEQNKYWETTYDQTRSRLLANVQKAWELPYRRFDNDRGPLEKTRETELKEKLSKTVIPEINFSNTSVREAVSRIQQEIRKQDPDGDPDAGVNMVFQLRPPQAPSADSPPGEIPGIDAQPQESAYVQVPSPEDIKINLNLKNVPAEEALKYVTELAGLKYKVDPYAVAIVPAWVNTDVMITKEYRVAPGFIDAAKNDDSAGIGGEISAKATAADVLKAKGVEFPAGASAVYVPAGNRLIVRNTQANLDLIEATVDTQVEASENQYEELEANEVSAAKQPFSTFSLHVSDVSFKLAKDDLAAGKLPDATRIRPEEFYNAFDYGDPTPRANEEVACRIEQSRHPLLQQRNLVRIGVKVGATGRSGGQPLRLTLLLDTSGSMEREDRAASIQKALEALSGLLGPNDKIALIGFARKPRLLSDWIPGDQAKKLIEIAASTPSEGGTNLEEALKLAGEIARKELTSAAQNRIVLFTDGAANLGDANPEQLATGIQKLRDEGIAFDACGVGAAGLNDEILEALTRKGDGRYYFLNSPDDADAGFARQLAGAFRPAAENVKVQVRFNPARVSKYRLIGFEEHRLKKEDFRNDKVDAAELAAEESAVAIYQIEPLPGGEGELGDVFVRFRKPGTENMVERSWTMTYDPQAPPLDQASATMQLAGTAALLAEKLKADPTQGYMDFQPLYPTINNLRGAFPNNPRVKDLVTMFEQTRKILGD